MGAPSNECLLLTAPTNTNKADVSSTYSMDHFPIHSLTNSERVKKTQNQPLKKLQTLDTNNEVGNSNPAMIYGYTASTSNRMHGLVEGLVQLNFQVFFDSTNSSSYEYILVKIGVFWSPACGTTLRPFHTRNARPVSKSTQVQTVLNS